MEPSKVTRTQAIQRMLLAMSPPHSQDLAKLYNYNMEIQVNVAQDGGQRINGDFNGIKWHGYTDGLQTWKPIRIPYDAKTNPNYNDPEMNFDITLHAEGIGMTGFDWKNRVSKFVAFDFDSITNHRAGLSEAELNAVIEKATAIPWVTVRKSTSGKGIHLYVFVNDLPTANHSEHAALARAILGKMSAVSGFDFAGSVDVCGGNVWVWHRKQKGTDGLSLVKAGTALVDIPLNWKDHLDVVKGGRRKVRPNLLDEAGKPVEVDVFEELAGQHLQVTLDEGHKGLMSWLENNMVISWWDADHHMLVCHTKDLKKAHTELRLKGVFETNSSASSTHNCFLFPMRNGQWSVRRYGQGVQEHESWEQDPQGWTRTYFNREPDLQTVARTLKGTEDEAGAYIFQGEGGKALTKAGEFLGLKINIPEFISRREGKLKKHKDKGRVIVSIQHDKGDKAEDMPGWLAKKGHWIRIYNLPKTEVEEVDSSYDDILRHIVSIDGEDAGWIVMTEKNWVNEPLAHVKHVLESQNYTPPDIKNMLGTAITKCWALVNKPFQDEYPGNREWNKDAAQLRFVPSQKDPEKLHFPTWSMILNHLGDGLNDGIARSNWAKDCGMVSGADYLKVWMASLFKKPHEPLPYLFFFGPQNCGKSMFHESLDLLMKGGCCRADNALTNPQGFNYELANKVLCVIEEVDLHKAGTTAYNRIKDWVTSRNLPIHQKNGTPYTVRNTSHWVQCANEVNACPIFPGDTRITAVEVKPIAPSMLIPRREFIRRLEEEAPDFLASILALELPNSNDRLNLPVINTEQKLKIIENNKSQTELFFQEKIFFCPGEAIELKEVYETFMNWLDPERRMGYSKIKFGRELPSPYIKGAHQITNQVMIGNAMFTAPLPEQLNQKPLVVVDGKMYRKID